MNKKIVGLISVFVVILVVLLIVLANRKPGSGTSTTDNTAANEKITLTWWNLFEPEENVEPLIKAFNVVHPEITIQYVQVGTDGIDDYHKEIESVLTDEDVTTSPDIFPVHNTWAESFRKYSQSAPSDVISSDDVNAFYSVVADDFKDDDGNMYALPLYLDTICLIYNKDLLSAAGYTSPATSWSDFELQAKALTKLDAQGNITQAGFSAYYSQNSQFYFEVLNNLLLQNGVTMISSDGSSKISDQANAVDALESYYSYVGGDYQSWDESFVKDIAVFLQGKLAIYAAPSWRLNDILTYNQQYNLGLKIGVTALPQYYNSPEYYFPSYWGLSVSKDSQHSQAAWEFIKFLTQEDQLKLLNDTVIANGRSTGIIYPLTSMADQNLKDELLAPYATSLGNAKTWKMYDGFALKNKMDELFTEGVDASKLESAINSVIQSKTEN